MTEENQKFLYDLISEHNKRVNITAITDYADFLVKHIKDSELGEKYIEGKKVLDIGSGAGFPGIVFAINYKEKNVTMIDSVNKKVVIINDIAEKMNLNNAQALHIRIEDFSEKESFDTVTARAVAPLNILAEYALPFVRVGGIFIAYKSVDTDKEIEEAKNAIKQLGGRIEKISDEILSNEISRRFVIIRKIKPCEKKHPRGKNLPRLKPL